MDKTSWDDISSRYDRNVEENKDPIIVEYLQREMAIVSSLCKAIKSQNSKINSVIDMGSGTGRVLFALYEILKGNSLMFYGIDNSEHMINRANKKRLLKYSDNQNIKFLVRDFTDPKLLELFEPKTANIVMCLYNTIGVVSPEKRAMFIDNMSKIAGEDGLVIISAFNGDNFAFVAPKLYIPMKEMVNQIDEDSFDDKNKVFKNSLGFRSQWFTKKELTELLQTSAKPNPIDVTVEGKSQTLGHVFANKEA